MTIGREEGNSVQLNDERVSRFHLKIQEEDDKLVLTDLESTNGTRVNGESVRMWVLRPGDVISLGRTLLLFGSPDEIATRLAGLRGADLSAGVLPDEEETEQSPPSSHSNRNSIRAISRGPGPPCTRCCRPSCQGPLTRARLPSWPSCSSIST